MSINLHVRTILCKYLACSVYHGLPKTHVVSKMGHAGMGTLVHFGTPQHTVYPDCSVMVCMGIIIW